MEYPQPFYVKRFGPKGPDSHKHVFCVMAKANQECARLGYCGVTDVCINGASGTNPTMTRAAVQELCNALNEQFERYMRGEFHSAARPIGVSHES